MLRKRDKLSKALVDIGLRPTFPDGGNFMLVDMSPNVDIVDLILATGDTTDRRLVKWLIKNKVRNLIVSQCIQFRLFSSNCKEFCQARSIRMKN